LLRIYREDAVSIKEKKKEIRSRGTSDETLEKMKEHDERQYLRSEAVRRRALHRPSMRFLPALG
jgi:hypothetical protein